MPLKIPQPENYGGGNIVAFTNCKSFNFGDNKFIHIKKYNYQKITHDNGVCCEMFSNSNFSIFPYCKCEYARCCLSDSKTACAT
jgi:hypothetical protein